MALAAPEQTRAGKLTILNCGKRDDEILMNYGVPIGT